MSCRRGTAPRGRDRCSVGSRTRRSRRPRGNSPWPSVAKRVRSLPLVVAFSRSQDWPMALAGLCLAVLGRDGIGAVWELPQFVVAEEDGVHGPQAQEEAEGQVADLTLRMRVGPHRDDVP